VQGRERHIRSGAVDKVAVDLASIDRLSVAFDSCSVDLVKIDPRLVDCSRGSRTHSVLGPCQPCWGRVNNVESRVPLSSKIALERIQASLEHLRTIIS